MFDKIIARRKIMRYLLRKKGEVNIKAVGTFTPWKHDRKHSTGNTLYAVMISRGLTVCPLIVRGFRKDHTVIRGMYEDMLRDQKMHGYHVGVREVSKL